MIEAVVLSTFRAERSALGQSRTVCGLMEEEQTFAVPVCRVEVR